MSVRPRDLILHAGGECLRRFGTLVWRPRLDHEAALTFARAGTAAFTGSDGVSRNASANRPRVEWAEVDGVRVPGLLLESAESETCEVVHSALQEELTLYASLVEQGNSGTAGVAQLGTATGASDARFALSMVSGTYRGLFNNGSGLSTTSAPSAAPSTSDPFELCASIAADGTLRFHQRIDGGSVETEQAAAGAPTGGSFDSNRLHFNATGLTNVGAAFFRSLILARGRHSLEAMAKVFA